MIQKLLINQKCVFEKKAPKCKSGFYFLLALFLFQFLFFSCSTIPRKENISDLQNSSDFVWNSLEAGFEYTEFSLYGGNADCYAVKIDLDTPNLEIVHKSLIKNPGFRLNEFAKEFGTIIAFNTTPFLMEDGIYTPVSITMSQSRVVTPVNSKYAALCFEKNDEGKIRAKIVENQDENIVQNYESAFGGFFVTMKDGKIVNFENQEKRSRQGCATDDEGKILYILTVISRNHIRDRNGLDYNECSRIFKAMGATQAMQFDGGHSTGLCVYEKMVAVPFLQRKIPAATGIRIKNKDADSK